MGKKKTATTNVHAGRLVQYRSSVVGDDHSTRCADRPLRLVAILLSQTTPSSGSEMFFELSSDLLDRAES